MADDGSAPHVVDSARLKDLLATLSNYHTLETQVEEALLDIADDFVDSVVSFAATLAQHRGSQTIEARDIALHLEKNWGIRVPGLEVNGPHGDKPHAPVKYMTEMHQTRLRLRETDEDEQKKKRGTTAPQQ
jgi:transcription initiation factor TFIID subunit 12